MIVCPTCRAEQMNGTLYCSECAADMQTPDAPTSDLRTNSASAIAANILASKPAPKSSASRGVSSKSKTPARASVAPAPTESPRASGGTGGRRSGSSVRQNFRLVVLNSGRILDCPEVENAIIGRSDAITGDKPDIDLMPDNAIELGVSRRHACINFRDDHPFITDLGSTNRTYINRQVLMRGQPYEVQDGDELRVGNIIIKVIFKP